MRARHGFSKEVAGPPSSAACMRSAKKSTNSFASSTSRETTGSGWADRPGVTRFAAGQARLGVRAFAFPLLATWLSSPWR
eukprot:4379714-Heterocapsa_arctica.AAC.1